MLYNICLLLHRVFFSLSFTVNLKLSDMKKGIQIYESIILCYDKDNKHTACAGERCRLESVYVKAGKSFVILTNSQGNKLELPFGFFEKVFYVSKDQVAAL